MTGGHGLEFAIVSVSACEWYLLLSVHVCEFAACPACGSMSMSESAVSASVSCLRQSVHDGVLESYNCLRCMWTVIAGG